MSGPRIMADSASSPDVERDMEQQDLVLTVRILGAADVDVLALPRLPEPEDAKKKKGTAKKPKGKKQAALNLDEECEVPVFHSRVAFAWFRVPGFDAPVEEETKALPKGKARGKGKKTDESPAQGQTVTTYGSGASPSFGGSLQQTFPFTEDAREALLGAFCDGPVRVTLEQIELGASEDTAKGKAKGKDNDVEQPPTVAASFPIGSVQVDVSAFLRGETIVSGWFEVTETSEAKAARVAAAEEAVREQADHKQDDGVTRPEEASVVQLDQDKSARLQVEVTLSRPVLSPTEANGGRIVTVTVDGVYAPPSAWVDAAHNAADDDQGKKKGKSREPPVFSVSLQVPSALAAQPRSIECQTHTLHPVPSSDADEMSLRDVRLRGVRVPLSLEEEADKLPRLVGLGHAESQGQEYVRFQWTKRVFVTGRSLDELVAQITDRAGGWVLTVQGRLGDVPLPADGKKGKKGKGKKNGDDFFHVGNAVMPLYNLSRPGVTRLSRRVYVERDKTVVVDEDDLQPIDPFVEAGTFVILQVEMDPCLTSPLPLPSPKDLLSSSMELPKQENPQWNALPLRRAMQQAIHTIQREYGGMQAAAVSSDPDQIVAHMKLNGQYGQVKAVLSRAVVSAIHDRYHKPAAVSNVTDAPHWDQLTTVVMKDLLQEAQLEMQRGVRQTLEDHDATRAIIGLSRALAADLEASGHHALARSQHLDVLSLSEAHGSEGLLSATWYEYGSFMLRAFQDSALAEHCFRKSSSFSLTRRSLVALACLLMSPSDPRYADAGSCISTATSMDAKNGDVDVDAALARAVKCVYLYLIEEDVACLKEAMQLAEDFPHLTPGLNRMIELDEVKTTTVDAVPFVVVADYVCRELGLTDLALQLCDIAQAARGHQPDMIFHASHDEDPAVHVNVDQRVVRARALQSRVDHGASESILTEIVRSPKLGAVTSYEAVACAHAQLLLGRACTSKQQFDKSVGCFETVAQHPELIGDAQWADRDIVVMSYQYAQSLRSLGRYQDAVEADSSLGSSVPGVVGAWLGVAESAMQLERLPVAAEAVDHAFTAHARHPGVWAFKALLEMANDRLPQAREALARARSLGFGSPLYNSAYVERRLSGLDIEDT